MKTRVGSESDLQGRLNAAVDGELGASDQNALEREMKRDISLKRSYQRLVVTREAIQAHAPRESAPAGIVKLIAGISGGGASFSSVVPRRAMVAGAVVVAIVIFMVAFGSFSPGR